MADETDPYKTAESDVQVRLVLTRQLFFCLSERTLSLLFERMEDEEIRNLSLAMSSLGTIKSNVVEQLLNF